jgi:hypothetical protein
VLVGHEQARERRTAHAIVQTVRDQSPEVRAPPPEVVVDVDRRDAECPRVPLERRDAAAGGERRLEQRRARLELQIVDHVDQEERDVRVVGHAAVQGARHRRHTRPRNAARVNSRIR